LRWMASTIHFSHRRYHQSPDLLPCAYTRSIGDMKE
jgi:hypothetical protein